MNSWSFPWLAFSDLLANSTAPLLPTPQGLSWWRHTAWSLVLLASVLLLARPGHTSNLAPVRTGRTVLAMALLLAVWAWLPGAWGLAYWLRLAFQTPSLSAALLALTVLVQHLRRLGWIPSKVEDDVGGVGLWTGLYLGAGVALGWVLLLDTFALFPVSVYAWGFQPSALALACTLALLPWVLTGGKAWRAFGAWQLCAALALFALWRWPSGNVWDAVLDPWLWLVLNSNAFRLVASRRRLRASDA